MLHRIRCNFRFNSETSYSRSLSKILVYLKKCCEYNEVPNRLVDFDDDVYVVNLERYDIIANQWVIVHRTKQTDEMQDEQV